MNPFMTKLRGLTLALFFAAASCAEAGDVWKLRLKHHGSASPEAIVTGDVNKDARPGVYAIQVPGKQKPDSTGYAEVSRDATGRMTIALVMPLGIEVDNEYDLVAVDQIPPAIEFTPSGTGLEIRVEKKPFTHHRVDSGPKPILYPLIGVDGLAYSRSYPMEKKPGEAQDHPHQRSFWFTYGQVNGVDFWAELKGHGSIKETSRKIEGEGVVSKTLRTTNDWLDASGKKLLEDERTLTVWNTKTRRVLDFDVTLKATEGPVVFGDTKEGMFGIRVPSSMDVKAKTGGRIVNAEGLVDGAAWGKRSPWVDYSGPVDGHTIGITILEHPESFGHPTPWHVRDYGLFAANPLGKHDFGLAKEATPTNLKQGESIRFRYRVVLHPGDATKSEPRIEYETFRQPPRLSIEQK